MTANAKFSESAKYKLILQLSNDQIRALEQHDFTSFQRILTAKGALIASLRGEESALAQRGLAETVAQIEESEKRAEMMLNKQLAAINSRLGEIQRAKLARRAYRREERKLPKFVPVPDSPLMFDLHS